MSRSSARLVRRTLVCAAVAVISDGLLGAQAGAPLASRITSVSLFKNGLAVVRREVTLPAAGFCQIDDVPEPVHGTFWIECTAKVDVRVTSRDVTRPVDGGASARLQTDLVGQRVHLTLRDPQMLPLDGVVIDAKPDRHRFSRDFEAPDPRWWWTSQSVQPGDEQPARFLIVQNNDGITYVDTSMIGMMTVSSSTTVKRRVPVLELNVIGPVPSGGAVATISYLAKGIAWTPAYQLDIGSNGELAMRQQAVVRNELEDLDQAQVFLITGFPSIEFAHVLSPLASTTSWASFFSQLNRRVGAGSDLASNTISQQAVSYNRADAGDVTALAQVDDDVDVHYQSIGARRLALGDSLMTEVAAGQTSYERLVEWIVPDTRDAEGRLVGDWQRQQRPEAFEDSPWDAIRFKNPFGFPLTTGPAMIVGEGRFSGQRTLHWAAPGELSTLRINKALSIRTHASEVEQPGQRELKSYGGHTYERVRVAGELLACNHRTQGVVLEIRRQFSGALVSADQDPRKTLREEGVYSVNPRYELSWKLPLAPGEQHTIAYQYDVLVLH